jgi:uncharacterized membrane-anchored protein
MKSLVRAAAAALVLFVGAASAQDSEEAFLASLDYRDGLVTLPEAQASLALNEHFRFLDKEDARAVLEDYWGNPEDDSVLGLLVPVADPLGTDHSWAVVLTYSGDGYISDEDAAEIDYAELLEDMQQQTLDSNEAMAEAGYPTSELVGWAQAPRYDATNKRLHWAKHLQFEGSDSGTLNYDIRVLGREGYLSMNAVADIADLPRVNAGMTDVLEMAKFNPGLTYADFNEDTDRTAAYGLAALVGGGMAAKAGLFAKIGLLLAKFWKLLLIGGVAAAAGAKKLFGSKDAGTVS